MKKYFNLIKFTLLAIFLISYEAKALTQNFSASVTFVTPLSVANVVNASFGRVSAGVVDDYSMDTAGAITAAGSGATFGGTVNAASVDITGDASLTMNLTLQNNTANGGVDIDLANTKCKYDGGAEANCNAAGFNTVTPGAGKALLIGPKITVDGTQTAGQTKTPTFDLVIVYN